MKGFSFLFLAMIAAALLMLSGGGLVIGNPPPFKTDALTVLIVEETDQRTTQLEAIEGAVKQAVEAAKGSFRRLDKDQTDLSKDDPWVAEAWKVKGAGVPWIVGADIRTGVNQTLPTSTPADAVKLLAPLGVK